MKFDYLHINLFKNCTTANFLIFFILILFISCQKIRKEDKKKENIKKKEISENILYSKDVILDSVFTNNDTKEHYYISKGIFKFYTCKNIKIWLDLLHKNLGKPDSIHTNSMKVIGVFFWKNKPFLNYKNVTISLKIDENKTPDFYEVTLKCFNENMQLIDNEVFENLIKIQIKNNIFKQLVVKKYYFLRENFEKENTNPRLEFYQEPTNIDSIQKLTTNDKSITCNEENFKVNCMVDTIGNITALDFLENKNDCNKIIKYQKMFKFPILYAVNDKSIKIPYKAFFYFKNLKPQKEEDFAIILNKLEGKIPLVEKERFWIIPKRYFGNQIFAFYISVNKLFIFQEKNQKLVLKQIFDGKENWAYLELKDLNFDNFPEIICSPPFNMNGNKWGNIYSYNFEKDIFILSAESFCCVDSGNFIQLSKKEYKSNQKYYLTTYGGSWYMPVITSIYSWKNQKLVLEVIFGKELLEKTTTYDDYAIFFVGKNINGKFEIIKQINLNAGEKYKKESEKISQQILDEYFLR